MDEAEAQPLAPDPKARWFEPVCAILMAITTLATAWCSFQNSRWSGQTSDLEAAEDAAERQAMERTLEQQQFQVAHLQLVIQATDAKLSGNEKLANFYSDRFNGELKVAWDKWVALDPFNNTSAPAHPFLPGFYTPRYAQEIHDAKAEAAKASARAKITGATAGNYLSNTVLLAAVLFFAGTAGKFDHRNVRQPSLFFAIALFLYAAVRMLMLPVA
jgi:hypothetical protein